MSRLGNYSELDYRPVQAAAFGGSHTFKRLGVTPLFRLSSFRAYPHKSDPG
jgi:hypothetical protein